MNIDEIKEIIAVLKNSGIVEFELEKAGVKVRIKRGKEAWVGSNENDASGNRNPFSGENKAAGQERPAQEVKNLQNKTLIKSPIVGTFYRSPSPDAEPYMEVGSIVKKGQIVCIIEAMKLMNEIESETDGKVVEILAENAHPVEYGEPLFVLEPI
ncbi:MAG: acetyl-CoA carboxylase biotin carboxyl carrier protein [Nitrospirae bacterium]|nr:acetyl-CoA carboxylase biotin carboxyl carrier protein [Nitrospirota bacterium]MBI3352555.1 acetyl-CoA carboxylase biotin carboxyl carrier protein [Nitrospirota bacterium]